MTKTIFYTFLVCFTAWCQAADEDSFGHAPDVTNNVQCVMVNKRNESRYSSPPGTNRTSDPCVVTFNDSEISAILNLARIGTVNIVDIHIKFQSNTSDKQINKTRWAWTNKLGLEILLLFAVEQLLESRTPTNLATKTLLVGVEEVQITVSENPAECISKENSNDVLAAELLKRISFSDINNELCYNTQIDTWYDRCCKMKSSPHDKNGHYCYLRSMRFELASTLLTWFEVAWYFFIFFGGNLVLYMIVYLPWKNECKNKWYHELNESPMSLSSISSRLFRDGYGPFKSTARRTLLVILVGYLVLQPPYPFSIFYFFFWAFCVFLELLLLLAGLNPRKKVGYKKYAVSKYLFFDAEGFWHSAMSHSRGAISLLTLPFNIKHWKESLQRLHHWTKSSLQYSNTIIQAGIYCLLCLLYIPITFVFRVVFIFFSLIFSLLLAFEPLCFDTGLNALEKSYLFLHNSLFLLHAVGFNFLLAYFNLDVILIISGILLNVVYFFPYITFVSVFSFHSWNFWKSVEEKYFILKVLIYEEIDDDSNDNDSNDDDSNDNDSNDNDSNDNDSNDNDCGCCRCNDDDDSNDNDSNDNDDDDDSNDSDDDYEIVCVVSKELYDKIRERLLPYDVNLFYFALKLFFLVGFCYIALSFVKIFQKIDVSPAVQLLTSLSFGALPYLLNIILSRKGDEEKAAWKRQLRVRVKHHVVKLTTNNERFRQIILKRWPNGNENEDEDEERLLNVETQGSSNNGNILQMVTSV